MYTASEPLLELDVPLSDFCLDEDVEDQDIECEGLRQVLLLVSSIGQ